MLYRYLRQQLFDTNCYLMKYYTAVNRHGIYQVLDTVNSGY